MNTSDRSQDQALPVPPPFLNRADPYDFGETLFGTSAQAAERFLDQEGRLEHVSEASLAAQIRRYIYNHESRARYVAAATNYLRHKRPCLRTVYDVILVGAGIHAAAFLYTLRKEHPNLRVLVVEKSEAICFTFSKMGDSLVLNSPTYSKIGLNSNIVEGHFIQVSDFDEVVEKPFPTAKHLHELATMMLFHADADILFNFEVCGIERSETTYTVSSATQAITARSVVLSNGMGETKTNTFDRDRVTEHTMYGDDFIASFYRDQAFPDSIRDKRVAVIGGGDTANCVMEYLLPLVYPNYKYGFQREGPFLPRFVYWIGQRAQNVQEFGLTNKHRYCHSGGLVEFFWNGETPFDLPAETWRETKALIKCIPDKLVSLSHQVNAIELVTSHERLEVDLVIDCTGRANRLSSTLLKNEYDFVGGDIVFYGGHWDVDLDQFVVSP
ncbi:MAG: FAD-dependent oxidoreductase, partial [Bacteroidota bacterium]